MTQADVKTDFEAVAFFVADHAVVENGKIYTNGAFWNQLMFPTYPAVISLSVVAAILVPWRAYQQDHQFLIQLTDADGAELPLQVGGQFRVGAGANLRMGDPTLMPIAVTVNNFQVERPGDYVFTLSIDGGEISRYNVRAVQTPGLIAFPPPPAAAGE